MSGNVISHGIICIHICYWISCVCLFDISLITEKRNTRSQRIYNVYGAMINTDKISVLESVKSMLTLGQSIWFMEFYRLSSMFKF